uniref:Uncharacterized protein n=1 Tax=Chondria tumulosa TaxID=2740715 RepID=A0A896SV13_9FLOR|nr:hypothetical protein K8K75_pgp182 [Chondria tumulosa]QSD57025.1 hypothetical protein [Chondria tumulosa]
MIKYWPNQPSIKLNNAIVELFMLLEKKITKNLSNNTHLYLYIDLLNLKNKNKLFKIILDEFKILILDLIELNLNKKQFIYLNKKIFLIFLQKVLSNFTLKDQNKKNYITKISLKMSKLYLFNELIKYLIFGSSTNNYNIFSFNKLYTPHIHVQILFENFIINTGNIIIKNIIENLKNPASIYKFFKEQNKCNYLYTSNRSITLFLNNLKLQNLVNFYIYNIKSLYNERERILLISSNGIITKYIYISNIKKIKCLNQIQVFFLFWLEIKDIIIPRIEKLLIQVSKYLIYFLINFFSNLVIIILRILIFYLDK